MDAVLGLVRHSGNDALFRALEMSLLATVAGLPLHLHAEGLRGTGKTSIMRTVRRVLPKIRRIKGCLYNCDPAAPHCPHHRGLSPEEVAGLGEEWVPMPYLEISHSAKVGTVVGSIDLSRLVSPSHPEAALLPGSLPQAHRGILFVDEINRLAETSPELADVLLDVMGTKPGRIQIEETGLPAVELPVQVTVWAASNPDEDPGPLEEVRRQLSDRFDFVVYTDRPGDAAVVEQILAAVEGGEWHRPLSAVEESRAEGFRSSLSRQAAAVRAVRMTDLLRQQIADLYSRFQVESLRAVQAIQMGARMAAALDHRAEASLEDLARVAPLALRHRVDPETLKKVAAHLAGLGSAAGQSPPAAAARPRLPSISFGGAALQPLPEPANAGAATPSDLPSTGPTPAQNRGEQSPARAPEWPTQYPPGAGTPQGESNVGWLARTLAGLRRNLGRSSAAPDPALPGQFRNVGGTPRSHARTAAGGAVEVADPLKTPGVAPVHPARSISELAAQELVRTEEELGRR